MPQRTKSSAKADSLQSEAVAQKRTKRLRVYSDDDENEGYESHQERRTSYNESYTRRGGSSPPARSKRLKALTPLALSSEDREENGYETQMRDYDDRREVEEEEERENEMLARDDTRNTRRGDTSARTEDDGDDSNDGGEYGGGRLSRKQRTPDSSPLTATSSWRISSPSAAPPPASQTSVVASSSNSHAQQGTEGRSRKPSMKARQTTSTKKSTTKGKQKAQSSNKRKRRQGDDSGGEQEYNDDYEDEEVNVDEVDEEEEVRFTDVYDEYEEGERPARGKKGRTGGGGGGKGSKARDKEKDKDVAPILKKAKFEGNPLAVNPTITSTTTTAAGKRPRAKKPAGEDATLDTVDETGTPDPSSIGSPTTTTATEAGKDDASTILVPPAKKRKLPTIKKLKNTVSLGGAGPGSSGGTGTGPNTPSPIMVAGGKPPALPPPAPGGITGNGVNKLGITEGSKARPKTNATTDLDLSNPSLYAELFKNPGGNASRTGLNRRAKEEERRKELDKMREDYKAKFVEESKRSFDLQGQADKMARFEEILRHRRSSALYPNFLAAKWREEWEREKRRVQRRDYQEQAQPNGHVDNTKEEGEM